MHDAIAATASASATNAAGLGGGRRNFRSISLRASAGSAARNGSEGP